MIKIKDKIYKIHFENKFFFDFINFLFEDCTQKNNEILLNINEAIRLPEYIEKTSLSYDMACQFFEDVRRQMTFLEERGFSIPTFSISDFFICDGHFIFITEKNIVPIENDVLVILKPFLDKTFFSPEMAEIQKLPSELPKKSWMFSIALLISTLMKLKCGKKLNWNVSMREGNSPLEQFSPEIKLLETIYQTKLYWALERCLYNDYNKRYFFLI